MKDFFLSLESNATTETYNTWDSTFALCSRAYGNALDTWKDEGRGEIETEEFYAFAMSTLKSALCDCDNKETVAWFAAQGVKF